jgi:hypothetical protein
MRAQPPVARRHAQAMRAQPDEHGHVLCALLCRTKCGTIIITCCGRPRARRHAPAAARVTRCRFGAQVCPWVCRVTGHMNARRALEHRLAVLHAAQSGWRCLSHPLPGQCGCWRACSTRRGCKGSCLISSALAVRGQQHRGRPPACVVRVHSHTAAVGRSSGRHGARTAASWRSYCCLEVGQRPGAAHMPGECVRAWLCAHRERCGPLTGAA